MVVTIIIIIIIIITSAAGNSQTKNSLHGDVQSRDIEGLKEDLDIIQMRASEREPDSPYHHCH